MQIKSYLAFPRAGQYQNLVNALTPIKNCEVTPAVNREILILITESEDEEDEKKFLDRINNITSLDHLTLVSGFDHAE